MPSEMPFWPIYLVIALGFRLILPVVTFLHELGHALAGRCFGAESAEIFVGTRSREAGARRIVLSRRLTLWLNTKVFSVQGGLCVWQWGERGMPGAGRMFVAVLAGPLASSVVAAVGLTAGFGLDVHAAVKFVLLAFAFLALLDLFANLWPRTLRPATPGQPDGLLHSDGYWLREFGRILWTTAGAQRQARWNTGIARYNAQDYAGAAPVFAQLLRETPNRDFYQLAFDAHCRSYNHAAALALAEEFPPLAGSFPGFEKGLAYLLAHTGRHADAIGLYTLLLDAPPATPAAAQAAAEVATQAAELHNELQANRGYTHLLAGHFPEARLDFEAVIARDPAHAYAHAQRGRTRLAQGDTAGLADLHHALALNPNEPFAHCNLGLHAQAAGRPAEALAHLQRAEALDPQLHALAGYLTALRAELDAAR